MVLKLLHIIIIINILISSSGITVFEHICNKKGVTTSFFLKPKSCCSAKKSNCHSTKNNNSSNPNKNPFAEFSRKPCCQDRTLFIKGNTLGIKQICISFWKQVVFEKSLPIVPFFYFVNKILFNSGISFQNYSSPKIILEIYKMIRTYRC